VNREPREFLVTTEPLEPKELAEMKDQQVQKQKNILVDKNAD